jgi:hypothetical protein
MKPCLCWLIVENGQAALFDYRVPVYWQRNLAIRDAKNRLEYGSAAGRNVRVVRVKLVVQPASRKEAR